MFCHDLQDRDWVSQYMPLVAANARHSFNQLVRYKNAINLAKYCIIRKIFNVEVVELTEKYPDNLFLG